MVAIVGFKLCHGPVLNGPPETVGPIRDTTKSIAVDRRVEK